LENQHPVDDHRSSDAACRTLSIIGLIVDPPLITGAPEWLKPAKFALSIAVYVFTLAWTFTFIPDFKRTRHILGRVTSIVMVLELVIIDLQAYRGATSHSNFSTPSMPLCSLLWEPLSCCRRSQVLRSQSRSGNRSLKTKRSAGHYGLG
jgi:hypothetical protein